MKAGLIAVGSIFALAIAYNIYLHNIHNAEIIALVGAIMALLIAVYSRFYS